MSTVGRRRARRAPLTPETIVDAALAVADAEGFEAVSMRRVASELGVAAMSLYHHVADKDELLELMSDALAGEVIFAERTPADWREALRGIALRTHASFTRHPWLIDAAGRRTIVTPNQLRHIEQSVEAVHGLDVDERTAIAMVMAVDDYTVGHAFRRARFAAENRPLATERERRRMRELLDTGDYPLLAAIMDADIDLTPPEDTFETALEWLLDGMEAMLNARRAG
jgi:AcrR family transcriptional regulator